MTFLVSFLVQTPQSSPSGLMAQPCCETPGDLWVKNSKNAVINIGWMSLSYQLWPKNDRWTTNEEFKNTIKEMAQTWDFINLVNYPFHSTWQGVKNTRT